MKSSCVVIRQGGELLFFDEDQDLCFDHLLVVPIFVGGEIRVFRGNVIVATAKIVCRDGVTVELDTNNRFVLKPKQIDGFCSLSVGDFSLGDTIMIFASGISPTIEIGAVISSAYGIREIVTECCRVLARFNDKPSEETKRLIEQEVDAALTPPPRGTILRFRRE